MRNILKRTLLVFIIVIMMIIPVRLSVFSNANWNIFDFSVKSSAATSGNFTYEVYNHTARITGYSSEIDGELVIPTNLDGYLVTGINKHAFSFRDDVTSVVFPEFLTYINNGAFASCANLISVSMPEGLKTIGASAFHNCQKLTDLKLPKSVTTIGDWAFYNCLSITSLTLPENLKSIGYSAFESCIKLSSVTFPEGLTTINADCFNGCSNLRSVTLPKGITTIASEVFFGCSSLSSITIPEGVTSIGRGSFAKCSSLVSITIPEGVTEIDDDAFEYCTRLNSVTLPESLTSIGSGAFQNCENLNRMTLPKNVTSIGSGAFRACINLVSINIPNELTKIESSTFEDCSKLYSINIPTKLTKIGGWAFSNCSRLPLVVLAEGITDIEDYAFYNCENLRTIGIPRSVTEIHEGAFYMCTGLKNVYYDGTADEWYEIYIDESNNPYISKAKIRYMGNKITTKSSNYNKNENQIIVITPKQANENSYDSVTDFYEHINDISDVKIKTALGEQTIFTSYSVAKSKIQSENVTLSKTDFYDFIIPKNVISSWSASNNKAYNFMAFMCKDKKDGKPYVSSVFARQASSLGENEYIEIRNTSLDVSELYTYDIIISAGNKKNNSTYYYLSQDNKHKISNPTGVFSSVDIAENFTSGKAIYAYVISDGIASEEVKLNLNITAPLPENIVNSLKNSTISLIGTDAQKIEIAENFPLLGGAAFNLDMFTFPVGVDVTGSRVRISLGLDIFSRNTEGNADGKQKAESEWMDFKKQVKGISQSLKTSKDAWKDYKKIMKNKLSKERLKTGSGFNVGVLGYIEMDVSNGASITDAYVSVNGEFSFSLTRQFVAWVVPVYISANAKTNVRLETQKIRLIDDYNLPFQLNSSLFIEPSLKLGGGLGVKNVVSGGVYGKGSLPFENNFETKHRRVSLKGEIGLEAEFFLAHLSLPLIDGELIICDEYYARATRFLRSFAQDHIYSNRTNEPIVSVVSRDYAEDTSEWLGEYPVSLYSLADNGVSFSVLQASIFEQSSPSLVSFGDNIIMAWVQDDTTRDSYNRMRLVYSIYDVQKDQWSEPKAVNDDGKNDAYPSLATDGENVFVTWQKINKTITENDITSLDAFLENSEIFVARYDAGKDCFTDVTQLTDNNVYDYTPSVILNNNNAVVYYATNNSNNLMGIDNNTLYRHKLGEIAQTVAENQSFVSSLTPELVNGSEKLSYSVDTDGDINTSGDITVFTVSNGKITSFDKGENDVAYTFADYSMLDGNETLFVSDMSNIYYESEGEVKTVFNDARRIEGNINFVETTNTLSILWTENNESGGNEFWTVSYEDEEWTEPVKISDVSNFKLSKADVAMIGGKLIGVCNMSEMTLNVDTGEYEEGAVNLCSFTANEFTDISLDIFMVDESKIIPGQTSTIDVYVNNNGTTDIESINFNVSDTLGTKASFTKNIKIKSGATELVLVDYPVPENYAATTLTVSASIPDMEESDIKDNSENIDIGKGDLSVMQTQLLNFGENYILKATIENNSAVEAEKVVVTATFNDSENETFKKNEIGTLSKEQYVDYELTFSKDLLEFDENGVAKLYIKVTSDSQESADGDNEICVAVNIFQSNGCTHSYDNACDAECNICGATRTPSAHNGGTATCKAKAECTECGASYGSLAVHKYDDATCTKAKICKVCGVTSGKVNGHKYDNACDTACNICGVTRTVSAHNGGTATCKAKAKCTECGASYGSFAGHKYDDATCIKAKICKICGVTSGKVNGHKYDNACDASCNTCKATRKITHSYKNTIIKATLKKNGKAESKCSVCDNVKLTGTVYYPKTIKLSKTAYTYNGKVQTPSAIVKDSKGNTLKKDTDYTVSYEKGRKLPGTYTVTITLKGKYTGTKKLTYTIAPKATSKITASQTASTITLKWNKVTGADGYRVYQYNAKTKKWVKVKDVTGTSLKISKLTVGTKYKFRVKAYTKDDGTIWGATSSTFETATKCKTPSIKKLTTTKGKVTFTWSNVSGERGYQVYYSTKKGSGYKKASSYKANVTKGSKSKLKSGKKYYFKVRAYTKTANGTVYSAWSSVKSVKVK